jgi:hypothetical protein
MAACSDRLEPAGLGIMTPEEEMSNAQLEYQVGAYQSLLVVSCTLLGVWSGYLGEVDVLSPMTPSPFFLLLLQPR